MSVCHTVILMIPALSLVFKTFFRFCIPQIQRDIPEYHVYFYPFCPPVSEAVLAPLHPWTRGIVIINSIFFELQTSKEG